MKHSLIFGSLLLSMSGACSEDKHSRPAPNTIAFPAPSPSVPVSDKRPDFSNVPVPIEKFAQSCTKVKSLFNTPETGRPVPTSFVNYRGYDQVSEAVFQLSDVSSCDDNASKVTFSFERTDSIGLQIHLVLDKKGDDQYQFSFIGSDCARKFYDFAKPRMIEDGIVWSPDFDSAFRANLTDEYCPKIEFGVRDELVKVLQQP